MTHVRGAIQGWDRAHWKVGLMSGVAVSHTTVRLDDAILRTLIYADVFDFPLTEREIHHFLIGVQADLGAVSAALATSPHLHEHTTHVNGYVTLRGGEATADARHRHDQASATLWPQAVWYGMLLAHLPFVRLVAITGSLAMRNAYHDHDDIDYMIVTAPGRVWLTRLLVVIVVRWARLNKVDLCPNYVLAETALAQDRCDLFMAHELAQMIPVAGKPLYDAMRAANRWADDLLPNASEPFYPEADHAPRGVGRVLQRAAEVVLSTPIGDILERWEYRRKLRKFAQQTQDPRSMAKLDDQQVKGHFNDHGLRIMDQYYARLADFGLD